MFFFSPTRGSDNTPESNAKKERVQELKEKMMFEIKALFSEQYDQMKKKKEQCATEVSKTELRCPPHQWWEWILHIIAERSA